MIGQFIYGKQTIEYELLNGCFICIGRGLSDGYPRIRFSGKSGMTIHRLVYIMEKNNCIDLPYEIVIRHTCDNPRCINPDHLISGSRAENTLDMMKRGRHGKAIQKKGRLSEDDVKLIREWYASGFKTQKELGEIFKVPQQLISQIINFKLYNK